MLIRLETPADIESIRHVHASAFADSDDAPPGEVGLVDALRTSGDLVGECTFVAVEDDAIVGHIAVSRGSLSSDESGSSTEILAIGPIAVLPECQRTGVGSALLNAALAAADARGAKGVILLGSPAFYSRFGFQPAEDAGVRPSTAWSREYFQLRKLRAWNDNLKGLFRYPPAFAELDERPIRPAARRGL